VVRAVTEGEVGRWRLYIGVATDSVLPEFVAAGIRVAGAEALVVRDSIPRGQLRGALLGYQAVPLLPSPKLLSSRTRWMLSPDSTALLAVEDDAGEQGEARPDGAVFATERLDCYARFDSVWDVAPSPDWRRLVYGQLRASPPDDTSAFTPSVGPVALDSAPRLVGALPADFEVAGAELERGELAALTRPVVVTVPQRSRIRLGLGSPALSRTVLPFTGGWRVAWARDGRTVLAGAVPRVVDDDEQPGSWSALPDTGAAYALTTDDAGKITETRWVTGPTIDPRLPVRLTGKAPPAARGRITSTGGWIRVAGRGRRGRILGPGVLLAATRDGDFVLALAPQVNALRDAPTAQLVVYAAGSGGRGGSSSCRIADVVR
jgi:hypothetical protein